ncbi:uncharacterized protein Z519_08420 [Cladophialophora bantiana CBS 173.52]|uniref:Uncharacterized protein n=1 Tax=Cladophialophora bantiana (strain ATCC 10958 / CBS 173.52 / CDC B-1940 / NIH 8579) TaxID=1442370 RepID=A0A0D2FVR1_CLAB1|nr:uncharacterized protein Z519_08420 [Cladophialophora bantiana CBS 173.52]KIW90637.1 hypothetical protein Z519_08420 [Cladophialophora bantiana CBS 173.52]
MRSSRRSRTLVRLARVVLMVDNTALLSGHWTADTKDFYIPVEWGAFVHQVMSGQAALLAEAVRKDLDTLTKCHMLRPLEYFGQRFVQAQWRDFAVALVYTYVDVEPRPGKICALGAMQGTSNEPIFPECTRSFRVPGGSCSVTF